MTIKFLEWVSLSLSLCVFLFALFLSYVVMYTHHLLEAVDCSVVELYFLAAELKKKNTKPKRPTIKSLFGNSL